MPAPIAKGIILLSSIIVAAGIAAYENPGVRAWIDERRRKIALTINEIADELDPQRAARRRRFGHTDASTREDDSAEAADRRRRAREEIMERGIVMERRRRAAQERTTSSSNFDDMVDPAGKLREQEMQAMTTSTDQHSAEGHMRLRNNQTQAMAAGSALANPFDDEMGGVINEKAVMESNQPSTEEQRPVINEATTLHIDTTTPTLVDNAQSERQELTPTTSLAASTLLSRSGVMTPTSTRHPHSVPGEPVSQAQQEPAQSYQSIQEWASAAASSGPASFYSPPESENNFRHIDSSMNTPSHASSVTASIIGTEDLASETGDLGVDAFSDVGADTPSAWSEVGSQISED